MTNHAERIETEDPLTVAEVREIAEKKIEKSAWDYYAPGADEQKALKRNSEAFNRDVTAVDTSTTIFGHKYSIPVGIAPTARQKPAGGNGEIDTSRAAAKLNLNMTLSAGSSTSLEEVIQARAGTESSPPLWAQVYLQTDVNKGIDYIKRAKAAGYEALVLTVDTPILGNRLTERRAFRSEKAGSSASPATYNRLLQDARTAQEAKDIVSSAGGSLLSAALTWTSTIPFLRSISPLKVILKGIMSPDDALLAVQHGADAIVVSNHGGRQLDSVPSTIEVLPEIVKVVAGRIPVILDGGITRGSDVFKALALGADLVLIGRPVLWGLALDGQRGVENVSNILERELSRTMALSGVTSIKEIDKSLLGVAMEGGFGVARL
ncbi:hypothetical protein SLS57_005688 [Botryosphaeria dothidea]